MKRTDTEIRDVQEPQETAAVKPRNKRRKDTDLSEESVRKSRRQIRREEEEAAAAERAPWEDPAGPEAEDAVNVAQEDMGVRKKKSASDNIVSVLSGNILSRSEVTRAYPYMIFVACLMFLYIANIFRTQYIYREHAALTEQVKELRAKSMTIASDKMKATRQSNIMVELERRGIPLRESLTPNKVIPNPGPYGQETYDR